MNPFARLFWLLVAASVPVGFGLLITGIEMFQLMNTVSNGTVIAPEDFSNQEHAAFAPAQLGLVISIPLWIGWVIYLLIVRFQRKE